MSHSRPLTLAQVADRMGKSLGWMHRHVRKLRDDLDFPRPIPGFGTYDPLAIDEWLARHRPGAVAAGAIGPDGRELTDDDWGRILDQRAAAMAAKAAAGRTGREAR